MYSKTPVSEFLLNIVAGFRPASLSKRECFHVNIAKFLRTTFFIEHLRWLLPKLFFSLTLLELILFPFLARNNTKICLDSILK